MRDPERLAARLLAMWLACAAVGVLALGGEQRGRDPLEGWQPFRPSLATAGWRELACVPGVGVAQAKAIVAGRAALGVPVTLRNVGLLPGVGPRTVEALRLADAHEGPG